MSISGQLITVRTLKQGASMEKGKLHNEEYLQEISTVSLNDQDLESLGLGDNMQALLKTSAGEVVVTCRPGGGAPGYFFMPLGHVANSVTPSDSQGTGVPNFKGVEAVLSRL